MPARDGHLSDGSILVEELLEHSGWMQALAYRLVGDGNQAEDVVQETWLAATRSGSRPLTAFWLARVLRNFAFQSHRAETRRRSRERRVAFKESATWTPEQLVERAEVRVELARAVLALEEPYRSTILLRFFEELSLKEVAAHQQAPVATVKTRLRRATDQLRSRPDNASGPGREFWLAAGVPLLPSPAPPSLALVGKLPASSGAAMGFKSSWLSLGVGLMSSSKTVVVSAVLSVLILTTSGAALFLHLRPSDEFVKGEVPGSEVALPTAAGDTHGEEKGSENAALEVQAPPRSLRLAQDSRRRPARSP